MALIPLKLPAGFYRTGTDLDAAGRWRDGSLVRWRNGSLRPIGGWTANTLFGTDGDLEMTGIPRAMHSWQTIDGSRYIATGSYNQLFAALASNTTYDLTIGDITQGDESGVIETGYGYGPYGREAYGTARTTGTLTEATTWSLDNWGENLVACSTADGRILEWQLSSAVGSDLITNGDFAADSDWTKGTGWAIASGVASWTGTTAANLEQTVTSLVDGSTYDVTIDLVDPDADANPATIPSAKILITGTTSGTTLVDKILVVGSNSFRFKTDDTSVDIDIYPASDAEPAFDVDNVTLKSKTVAEPITNAPINNIGLIVTEERFLFALGASGNPRKVQWSDREDNTTWTAQSTNEAGDIELQSAGEIQTAIRTRGQTLILTTTSAHTARYIGPPYVYGFERVGTSCGVISRQAVADVDAGTFWMGQRGFFTFNGNTVAEISCEVHDHVFGDMNQSQVSKIWAVANGQHGEIWWFYCSSGSNEIDRYVAYDYKENHWLIGSLSRTCGVERNVFPYQMLVDADAVVYDHERGLAHSSQSVYAESGPISIGSGDNIMQVTDLITDEQTQGDVNVTFKSRYYPNDTEYTHGPYAPSDPTSVRFSGRQVRMKVEGQTLANWKVGTMRIDAKANGRR